jgi:peptidoglycan/LPS O-acetylase OafA/YrhL
MKDLPNLDFLRSIAVLLVMASHLLLYTGHGDADRWSGNTGVCMFFVHTSLVLMWSLERDPHVWRFYIRRIFRIYPLWLMVLFLTLAVHLPIAPIYAPQFRFFSPGTRDLFENIFLTFNLSGGAKVVGASWSLPIEVDMYLALPALFAFAQRFRTVLGLLLLDAFVMIYARMTLPPINSSLVMCIPYFLPGVMAYLLMRRTSLQRLSAWLFPVWLGVFVAAAHFYGSFRTLGLFCLALGLSLPLFRQSTWKFLNRVSAQIAKYSYGIYLSHMAAIVVAVYLLRGEPAPVRVAAFIVTVSALSFIFYHLVEAPMIRLGAKLARKIEDGPSPPVNDATMRLEPAP